MRARILVGVCVIAAAFASLARPLPAGPSAADDAAAIRAARDSQNIAIAAHDIARISSFWTEDVTITAGLGTILQGREAYARAFRLDANIVYYRRTHDVAVSANWPVAFETGSWTGGPSGGTPIITGRYSAQWIKQQGAWRIHSEVFVALACTGEACAWPVAFAVPRTTRQ
jgi:ketosteroid isomerase-like protein